MIFKNFEQLATSPERKQALLIAESGLAAITTKTVIQKSVQYNPKTDVVTVEGTDYALPKAGKLVLVGFGKASFEAATSLYALLGSRIACGFVLDLKGGSIGNLTCTIGSHPYPTVVNVEATKEIVTMLGTLEEQDTVLCVVSGGGSSLLCYPYEQSCEMQTNIVGTLMHKGATIEELNTVRKHISRVKGGQLAEAAYPARIINLIFSDVPSEDPSMVASGPTLFDPTTVDMAAAVLQKYNVLESCSLPHCRLTETPKDKKYFEKVTSHVVVSAHKAIVAMKEKAEDLGFSVRVYKEGYSGQARELAREFSTAVSAGECLLASGESMVTIKHEGKGGRNLEMALASLPYLRSDQVYLALDTDGFDNTDFAGAIVDNETSKKASVLGLDPVQELENNSSYN